VLATADYPDSYLITVSDPNAREGGLLLSRESSSARRRSRARPAATPSDDKQQPLRARRRGVLLLKVRYPRHDDQTTQAHCHSLVVNACVLSTTGYLQDAIDALRADGQPVSDDAISHLSPGHYEPINPYGTLNFDVADVAKRPRRPLRSP